MRARQHLAAGVALVAALLLGFTTIHACAKAGESAHLALGIVGTNDYSPPGVARGVRVVEVFGPHAGQTLKRGDVVIGVDGRRVRDGQQLADAIRDGDEDWITVNVERNGRIRELWVPRQFDRMEIRSTIRDVDREVVRDVMRGALKDIHRDLDRHRDRDVIVIRDAKAEVRESMERLRRQIHEVVRQLEAEDWY